MKSLKRFITVFLSFVLVTNIFINSSLPVFASGTSPSMEFQFPSDWDDYTLNQKAYFMSHDSEFKKLPIDSQLYYIDKYKALGANRDFSQLEDTLACLASGLLGVSYSSNVSSNLMDAWMGARDQAYENDVNLVTRNEKGEVYLSDAYLSIFNEFLNEFVDANSPKYRVIDTTDLRTISATSYTSKDQWEKAIAFLNNHPNDVVARTNETVKVNGTNKSVPCFYVVSGEDILFYVEGNHNLKLGLLPYDNDWNSFTISNWGYSTSWEHVSKYFWDENENNFTKAETCTFTPDNFIATYFNTGYIQTGGIYFYNSPVSFSYKNGKALTVFKTREHAIQWVTGQRDVYTTSGFNNYQSGNNIRITGDTLTNSGNTYNTVNNIVNNYYQNGGSDGDGEGDGSGGSGGYYTDGDIQDLIDKAVEEALRGSDDSSGGSGSGSGDTNITVSGGDSSGGGGLSGGFSSFLDGLGKILDAILYILGKLLEYIGKAIELFVDTIGKILDIVPKAFSDFLAAVFPFFPTEIFTAIELILALSVVLMVIKMFKK